MLFKNKAFWKMLGRIHNHSR